jgi:hypothetical protein
MIQGFGLRRRRVVIIDITGSPKQRKPDMADDQNDYKVGPGRPPLHTRFRKGVRQPRRRSQKKLHALLADALNGQVFVNGRRRTSQDHQARGGRPSAGQQIRHSCAVM